MEQNNWQIGCQEAGLTNAVGSLQNYGVVAFNSSDSSAANGGAIATGSNGAGDGAIAAGGASAAANGGASATANAGDGAIAVGGASAAPDGSASATANGGADDGAIAASATGCAAAGAGASAAPSGGASAITNAGGDIAAATGGGAEGGGANAAANGGAGGGAIAVVTGGVAAGGGAAAAASSDVCVTAAGPSSRKRRIQRHTHQQINALEMYFKEDAHPNRLKINEFAQILGMEPLQVLFWFQNKRTQTRSQNIYEKSKALRSDNDILRAQIQHFMEVISENICPECGISNFQQSESVEALRSENIRLREEAKQLRSAVTWYMAGQDPQNIPIAFQDSPNPSISQDPQNLPTRIQNPQNLISQTPQTLAIPEQNPRNLQIISQNSQDLHMMSEADNARTGNTSSVDRLATISSPTLLDEFRQSINALVRSAAEELKWMAMSVDPVWISSSADGMTSILNEIEYLVTVPNFFGPTRLGYTCEASRHIARVSLSPEQLLNILMNVNEWALVFSSIVSRAFTLGVLSEGIDHNTALQVVDAEYHIPTPLVPEREICFARYCTEFSKGVWVVVDVSLDNILPNYENTTCQKKSSGCLIQAMADGTSKITWIEHVYVDYNSVGTMYKHLIHSGLGFGAKRWVSILERQGQRLATAMSSDVPSTRDFHNLLMSSPDGRRGIMKFAESMANNFFVGITGPKAGRWNILNWNFGDDVRLMSTRVKDDPSIQSGTLLSVSTSFVLSDSPKMVFDFLRDHSRRKEWDINANGNDYEPVFNISYGKGAGNLVSIYKVLSRSQGHMLVLQESWSDAVASHIVFSTIEIGIIDVILGGGNPNGLHLLPSGFTILPDGPSLGEEGTRRTLLTVSFQVMVNTSPVAEITLADAAKVVQILRSSCENIKHALDAVDPNA